LFHEELPEFECGYGDYCQQDADDPKAGYDFGFVDALLLVMVVEGRHQEDSAPFSVFNSCVFKVAHLKHDA
jgi:hypothetical protein